MFIMYLSRKPFFKDIRIELRVLDGEHAACHTYEGSITFSANINTPGVFVFHSLYMHPLTKYYIHQAGGGGGSGGVGPIYSLSPFMQRGHGIGDYLGPLFRVIKPWLFSCAKAPGKALGRVALQTGSHILSDIADNLAGYKDIIPKHIRETVPAKMAGGGRKRKRRTTSSRRPAKRSRRTPPTRRKPKGRPKRGRRTTERRPPPPTIKRDIFA